jgi:hypothetical protein
VGGFAAVADVDVVGAEAAGAGVTVAGLAGLAGVASAVDFAAGALVAGVVEGVASHSLTP